jgi:sugar phosphate isomerase/epimerase
LELKQSLFDAESIKKIIKNNIKYSDYSIYYPECRSDIDKYTDLSGLFIEARAEHGYIPEFKGRIRMVHSFCSDPSESIPYLSMSDKDPHIRKKTYDLHCQAIETALKYEASGVTVHPDIKYFQGKPVSDYENMLRELKKLCKYAEKRNINIFFENNFLLWRKDLPSNKPAEIEALSLSGSAFSIDIKDSSIHSYAVNAQEWGNIAIEMKKNRQNNFYLCFCFSHAVTSCMVVQNSKRLLLLKEFLDYSEFIKYIHWADNYLYDNRGIFDNHLPIGEGTVPDEIYLAFLKLKLKGCLELWSRESGPMGFSNSIDYLEQLKKIIDIKEQVIYEI